MFDLVNSSTEWAEEQENPDPNDPLKNLYASKQDFMEKPDSESDKIVLVDAINHALDEELNFNDQTIYFYDNILLESYFKGRKLKKMKENFRLVDYNFSDLNEIIINNANDNADPKPLYISNYY